MASVSACANPVLPEFFFFPCTALVFSSLERGSERSRSARLLCVFCERPALPAHLRTAPFSIVFCYMRGPPIPFSGAATKSAAVLSVSRGMAGKGKTNVRGVPPSQTVHRTHKNKGEPRAEWAVPLPPSLVGDYQDARRLIVLRSRWSTSHPLALSADKNSVAAREARWLAATTRAWTLPLTGAGRRRHRRGA